MADDQPDAIVIVHYPADGAQPYGIGPFPPIPDLVDAILANPRCGCRLELMPVVFPKGITMAIGVDTEDIEQAVAEVIGDLYGPLVDPDRLN